MGGPEVVANDNAGENADGAGATAADSSTGVLPGEQGLERENLIGSSGVLVNGEVKINSVCLTGWPGPQLLGPT